MTNNRKTLFIGSVLAVAVLAGIAGPWMFGSDHRQSTNDAYVIADYTVVAPKIAGFIKEVLVEDNQQVKAGQLLATIDARDYQAALDAAAPATPTGENGTAIAVSDPTFDIRRKQANLCEAVMLRVIELETAGNAMLEAAKKLRAAVVANT